MCSDGKIQKKILRLDQLSVKLYLFFPNKASPVYQFDLIISLLTKNI